MNIYTMKHPTVKKNILKAMLEAVKTKKPSKVKNRKGITYIIVNYSQGNYTFTDNKGIDLYYNVRYIMTAHRLFHRIKEQLDKPCYTMQGVTLGDL